MTERRDSGLTLLDRKGAHMLVSYNWIKEFVEIEESAERVAEILTMGGIEVESVIRTGAGLETVLTARVDKIVAHPKSEKLSLVTVSLGNRVEEVVCGAPNVREGQVVAYAVPGTVLPSGTKIVEREILGAKSPGMICSEKELGLGEDASGILALDTGLTLGVAIAAAMPFIEDFILETSVTPNRGDCLSGTRNSSRNCRAYLQTLADTRIQIGRGTRPLG